MIQFTGGVPGRLLDIRVVFVGYFGQCKASSADVARGSEGHETNGGDPASASCLIVRALFVIHIYIQSIAKDRMRFIVRSPTRARQDHASNITCSKKMLGIVSAIRARWSEM